MLLFIVAFGVADKLELPNSSILHSVISKLHTQHNKFDMLHRLGRVMLIRSVLSCIAVLSRSRRHLGWGLRWAQRTNHVLDAGSDTTDEASLLSRKSDIYRKFAIFLPFRPDSVQKTAKLCSEITIIYIPTNCITLFATVNTAIKLFSQQ